MPRKAADGGGRRGKGRQGRKYTKTSARFPQHARAEPAGCKGQQKWVFFPVLCSKHSQSQLLSRPPLFLCRLFPFPWTYFTPFTAWIREGCSNTTCFLRPPLGSSIRPLPPRLFFSFPFFFSSFGLFFIYLQLDACSSIDYFTKDMRGFVSAVLGALYRDLLTHTRPGRVHVVASRPQGRTHLKPAVRLLMNFACRFTTTDGCMTVNSLPAPPLVIGLHWWWLTKVHRSSLFYS